MADVDVSRLNLSNLHLAHLQLELVTYNFPLDIFEFLRYTCIMIGR